MDVCVFWFDKQTKMTVFDEERLLFFAWNFGNGQ